MLCLYETNFFVQSRVQASRVTAISLGLTPPGQEALFRPMIVKSWNICTNPIVVGPLDIWTPFNWRVCGALPIPRLWFYILRKPCHTAKVPFLFGENIPTHFSLNTVQVKSTHKNGMHYNVGHVSYNDSLYWDHSQFISQAT